MGFDRERDLGRLDLLPQAGSAIRRPADGGDERLELVPLALLRGAVVRPLALRAADGELPVVVKGDDLAVDEDLQLLLRMVLRTRVPCR